MAEPEITQARAQLRGFLFSNIEYALKHKHAILTKQRKDSTIFYSITFIMSEYLKPLSSDAVITPLYGEELQQMKNAFHDHWEEIGRDGDCGGIVEFEGLTTYYLIDKSDYISLTDGVRRSSSTIDTIDIDKTGVVIGEGVIVDLDQGYKDFAPLGVAYVGYTQTIKEYREKGLGARRLKVMNSLSKEIFGKSLYSDITEDGTELEAVSLWRTLESEGLAETFYFENEHRYVWRFK